MKARALAALLAGATGIGCAPLLVRWSEVGPSATAFYRILFALPFLWLWLKREEDLPRATGLREALPLLGLAGFFFTGDLVLWHWSLRFTSVANSTLFTNLAPLVVTLGARWLFGERVSWQFMAGIAMAIGGAARLVDANLDSRHGFGDLLAISTAVFYGAYQLCVKQLRRKLTTAAIMFWSGVFACAGFLVTAAASREILVPATARGWVVLLALALISHLGGQTLIAYAFGHLSAGFCSVGLLFQPVVAAGLAWLLLSEALSWAQVLGGVVVLGGIALAGQGRQKAAAGSVPLAAAQVR